MSIAVYGLMLYAAGFRKIEFEHFEMALQPEKILLFFMLEEAYLRLWEKRKWIMALNLSSNSAS